jgi:hypothetical protein
MKKQRIIGIVLLAAAGLLIAGTGIVYAGALIHGRTPMDQVYDQSNSNEYIGPMRGFAWQTNQDGEFPPMMTAMIEAVAEKTGLTVEEIQTKLLDGERLYTIATDAGMSDEEYNTLMEETHDSYFEQNQGQFGSTNHFPWMQDRMQEQWEDHGFGFSNPYNDGNSPFSDGSRMPHGGCW